jgi:hypothetical protein
MSYNKKVLGDSEVPGGEGRRDVDRYLSENLGGYRSIENGGEIGVYGKYVEPILHATEHTGRAIWNQNSQEWARAKDELNTVGSGLHTMDKKYQNENKQ